MEVIQHSNAESAALNLIAGNNFSGRSAYLRILMKTNHSVSNFLPYGVMLGEIPANYISGLAPTVNDEISLHTVGTNKVYESRLNQLIDDFDFEKHLYKNPFELSGGEQAILIIICALLLEPKQLAIDVTIEQINREWRTPLLKELSRQEFIDTKISIADNRFNEYSFKVKKQFPSLNNANNSENVVFEKIICPSEMTFVSAAKNLSLNNLSFGYSAKQLLLQNLNYEFQGGKIYHLNGINGAGKSTLSKILTGVLKPSKGKIVIDNNHYNAFRYPGKIIGYSFQNPDEQLFSNTIRDEIIPNEFLKANKNISNAEKIITSFGLNKLADKHPAAMPFVIRKRIALAATLAHEREWYILDEPTLGQDSENVNELTKLIKLFVSRGKGIILISHSENFVSSFENVITVTLKEGNLID